MGLTSRPWESLTGAGPLAARLGGWCLTLSPISVSRTGLLPFHALGAASAIRFHAFTVFVLLASAC